jgi:L-alanine-DL-glutamate epimerase-like enolase superfamily enzyme
MLLLLVVKLKRITAAGLRGATPEGGWSNELRPDDVVHTLVAVHTDTGAVGVGSVFSNDALVRAALAARLEPLVAQGFRAFKIGWGPFGRGLSADDEAIVARAREAIGSGAQLMVDAGASDGFWPHGLTWALRTADMLAAYDVAWFEEPLRPDALEDHRELRRQARVPIAGGEVLTRRQSFRPWIEGRALDVVQPDVTKVGGLSEQRRIAWAAQDHDLAFVGHGWNTAVGLAADLHLAAALPHTDLVEYVTGSPYVDELTVDGFALDADGMLPVPAAPGLGIALDPDAVERLTGDRRLLDA